jgi:hypothetical protein
MKPPLLKLHLEDKMGTPIKQQIPAQRTTGLGFGIGLKEPHSGVKGEVFFTITHPDNTVEELHRHNVYTLDGGILAAMLFSATASGATISGPLCLAVGTGAKGSILNPDLADNRQRQLNTEIARKEFSSVVYRTSTGAIATVPTNIVDFTTVFTESEANASLNEMGLVSPFDPDMTVTTPVGATFPTYDDTIDMNEFDRLLNYLTFPVISKISGSVLAITWRLTF